MIGISPPTSTPTSTSTSTHRPLTGEWEVYKADPIMALDIRSSSSATGVASTPFALELHSTLNDDGDVKMLHIRSEDGRPFNVLEAKNTLYISEDGGLPADGAAGHVEVQPDGRLHTFGTRGDLVVGKGRTSFISASADEITARYHKSQVKRSQWSVQLSDDYADIYTIKVYTVTMDHRVQLVASPQVLGLRETDAHEMRRLLGRVKLPTDSRVHASVAVSTFPDSDMVKCSFGDVRPIGAPVAATAASLASSSSSSFSSSSSSSSLSSSSSSSSLSSSSSSSSFSSPSPSSPATGEPRVDGKESRKPSEAAEPAKPREPRVEFSIPSFYRSGAYVTPVGGKVSVGKGATVTINGVSYSS